MTVKEVVEKYARILMLPLEDSEEWRVIKDYPNYIVTSLGRVFNIKTGHELKANKNHSSKDKKHTYITRCVILSNNGKTKMFYVHRLVAIAFLGKPEGIDLVVNHKNHNTSDNRVENLEWITKSENSRDKSNTKYINKTIDELIELRKQYSYASKEYRQVNAIISYYRRKKQQHCII